MVKGLAKFYIFIFKVLCNIGRSIVYSKQDSEPTIYSETVTTNTKSSELSSNKISATPLRSFSQLDWEKWPTSTHYKKGQYTRFHHAIEENIQILNRRYPTQIQGTTGNIYTTTFMTCSCPDFKKRNLPCKHIYKLALSQGLITSSFLELPVLPKEAFDQNDSPSEPYSNYMKRSVRGYDEVAKKKKEYVIYARSMAHIEENALKRGLTPPYKIIEPYVDPTEPILSKEQQKIVDDSKIRVPQNALKYESHDIIDRILNDDLESPDLVLAQYADHIGCHFSLYIGDYAMKHLLERTWQANVKEASAFYVYNIYRIEKNLRLRDFSQLQNRDTFLHIAEGMTEQMLKYIQKLNFDGIMNPSKRSNAYKYSIDQIKNYF